MPNTMGMMGMSEEQGEQFMRFAAERMGVLEIAENLGEHGLMAHWPPHVRLRMLGALMTTRGSGYEHFGFQLARIEEDHRGPALRFVTPDAPAWLEEEWGLDHLDLVPLPERLLRDEGWHADASRWLGGLHRDPRFGSIVMDLALGCLPGQTARGGAAQDLLEHTYYCCGFNGFVIASDDQAVVMFHGMFC